MYNYGHMMYSSGFACGDGVGEICFSTTADLTDNYLDCIDYLLEIEFPTGKFIPIDFDPDFYLYYTDATTTIYRCPIFLIYDYEDVICLTGYVHEAGTPITYRIKHPGTGISVDGGVLIPDDYNVIGAPLTTTLLSQAISNGDLLPASQAVLQPQSILIEGTLIVDQDYTFGANFVAGGSIQLEEDAAIEVLDTYTLKFYNSRIS